MVVEVPYIKKRNGNKIVLEVTIKDLPKGEEDIKNLIAGVKRNGEVEKAILEKKEKSKSGFFKNLGSRFTKKFGPKIREIAQKIEAKRILKNRIKKIEKSEKEQIKKARTERIEKKIEKLVNNKKFVPTAIAAGFGTGIILIAIPIFARGCQNTEKTGPTPEPTSVVERTEPTMPEPSEQTIEIMVREEKPFDIEFYDINNPYEILEGIINSAGQEGLTANNIEGDSFEGNLYNANEQFEAENRASEGVEEFKQIKIEIYQNLQILTDPSKSNDDKKIAVQRLVKLNTEVETIFSKNEEFAEEYAKRFEEASRAFEDTNTEKEIIAVNGMVENFKSEIGLSSHNISEINLINQLLEQGYELDIKNAEKDLRGTWEISGEAIKDVIKKVNLSEAKDTWNSFATFTKGQDLIKESTIEITKESGGRDDGR